MKLDCKFDFHLSFIERLENIISSLLCIVDELISIATFSYIQSDIGLQWMSFILDWKTNRNTEKET